MRYRNYKSYSSNAKQSIPNLISESVVDYFVDSKITHPYIINTIIYDKSCTIYTPKTNTSDLKSYLNTKNFDLVSRFDNITYVEHESPFYSDFLNYGNYYGYAIQNDYNSIPLGKSVSDKIISQLNPTHSNIIQLSFDTHLSVVTRLSLFTSDKSLNKINILPLSEFITEETKITITTVSKNVPGEFYTNNSNLYLYHELPSHTPTFVGTDPMSPSRILPMYLRYVAKSMVNSSLMNECLITANYSQDSVVPVTLNIDSFGTEKYPMKYIYSCLMDVFPLSLKEIREELDFYQTIYRHSAESNYFNDSDLPWENTDKSKDLIIF